MAEHDLETRASIYANSLAKRLPDNTAYWRAFEDAGECGVSSDRFTALTLACGITELQARLPDGLPTPWPEAWRDCRDMIARLCELVPDEAERERLADLVKGVSGLRPDLTETAEAAIVRFPGA